MQLEKAAKTTFIRKIRMWNVDEIDTSHQAAYCGPRMFKGLWTLNDTSFNASLKKMDS